MIIQIILIIYTTNVKGFVFEKIKICADKFVY